MIRPSLLFQIADQCCEVLENRPVNWRYKRLVLRASSPAIEAKPGQFFHILCNAPGAAPFLRRPMSVFRANPGAGTVEFLYRVKGTGTLALAELRRGEALSIVGPLGTGFRLDRSWRRILILARGVGLATLAPIADWAKANGTRATAILSARSPDELMDREFAGDSRAGVMPVFDSDGSSEVGRVESLARCLVRDGAADALFTCGSNRLLLLAQRLARDFGLPGQVALEQQMGCGLGMCLSCVCPIEVDGRIVHKRVCTEGPVFDLLHVSSWQ
jgi:dihydroorotate dehydrogenase electron transfer subunit